MGRGPEAASVEKMVEAAFWGGGEAMCAEVGAAAARPGTRRWWSARRGR